MTRDRLSRFLSHLRPGSKSPSPSQEHDLSSHPSSSQTRSEDFERQVPVDVSNGHRSENAASSEFQTIHIAPKELENHLQPNLLNPQRRSSDASHDGVEALFTATVKCVLLVTLRGKRDQGQSYPSKSYRHPLELEVPWQDPSYFQELRQSAKDLLVDKKVYDPDCAYTRLYLQNGNCRLLHRETDFEVGSCFLDNRRHWKTQLQKLIGGHLIEAKRKPFLIEVHLQYADICIVQGDGEPLAMAISETIHQNFETNFLGEDFVPRKVIEHIFDKPTVTRLIEEDTSLPNQLFESDECPWASREDFTDYVYLNGVQLFALCVYASVSLKCLYHLLRPCLSDDTQRIPLIQRTLTKSDCPTSIKSFEFDRLIQLQSKFNAHIFSFSSNSPRNAHSSLDAKEVVPLQYKGSREEAYIGRGAFGVVYRVQIHPDHHYFDPVSTRKYSKARSSANNAQNRGTDFALKVFHGHRQTGAYFEKEEEALRKLAGIEHDNLVLHLAAWTQNGLFYMLFPCAESNLTQYMSVPAPPLTELVVRNVLTQLRNIVGALELIHKMAPAELGDPVQPQQSLRPGSTRPRRSKTGFHFDVKPENILIFKHITKAIQFWKIADFGTTRINDIVVSHSRPIEQGYKSYQTKSPTQGDPVWGAPDFAVRGATSRPYDIWSLGCVFLQVLLWLFDKGYPAEDGMDGFELARLRYLPQECLERKPAFWFALPHGHKKSIKLNPLVVKKLEELRDHCKFYGAFADLVQITIDMLRLEPETRPRAAVVWSDIDAILIQANEDLHSDPDYYLRPRPSGGGKIAAPPTEPHSRSASIDRHSIVVSIYATSNDQVDQPDTPERGRRHIDTDREAIQVVTGTQDSVSNAGGHLSPIRTHFHRGRSASLGTLRTPENEERPLGDAFNYDANYAPRTHAPLSYRDN